ncbi:MAG TPA: serpin family protein, partial [Rhabdochlamydiaceae bacterium]|nr:serpin family protein [Rhabdochlamydiaceae bacterium]
LQAILKGTQEGQGSGLQFKMGNALAVNLTDQEKDVPLPPAYINGLVKVFDVKVIGIKDGPQDIPALNAWICQKSGLKDVLSGYASRNTRAMIIQALSFLGKFSVPMDKNMTLSRQFVGANRGPVRAWFMYGDVAPKGADHLAQAARAKNMYAFRVGTSTHSKYFYEGVCLNYQRDDYGNSGYFRIWIKPANPEISIEEFLNNLDLQKVCQEIRNIPLGHRCDRETHPVEFHLPKTKMDLALDFIPILRTSFGLNTLVLPGALQINNIIQRCFMKEDEEGTQVQAATVAYVSRSMPRQPPAPVVFDRPFVGVVMSDEAVIGASIVDAESLDLV